MPTTNQYIHGSEPDEQARLDTMNTLINQQCLDQLGDLTSKRIIDFGSGMGQFSRCMARAAGPDATVIGIERDDNQREQSHALAAQAGEASLVEFRAGDVNNPPLSPDELGTFDLAWSRYVLEHVQQPLAVVQNMANAIKPGGTVALVDDDHEILKLWPELPGFDNAWRAYMQSYSVLGYDPIIGRKLPELLAHAGLTPTRCTTLFYGSCTNEPHFNLYVENLIGIMRTAIDVVVAHEIMPLDDYKHILDELEQWATLPGASLWYAMHLAQATKSTST